jgi:2-polyprenyl-6-hydroxyphenyl methylase/3-demethylubiquinone-9 3-methyltransferase
LRNDLDLYERHGDEWWDPSSPRFRTLQQLNRFRLGLIREWLGERLAGSLVVDLGCGGGLLGAPLAEAGARVIGLDISGRSLRTAHERVPHGALWAQADLTRTPVRTGCADLVLAADVLEHLEPFEPALAEAARLLKRGGHLYVNTLNKTRMASLIAVTIGETWLGVVPRGTHDPRLFIRPDDLRAAAEAAGLEAVAFQGEMPAVRASLAARAIVFRKTGSLGVTYSALFRKKS